MPKLSNNIIGRGWAFPPAFDLINREVEMVTGKEDIEQSLRVLFSTQPGERILELGYGCDLSPSMFKNISLSQKTVLENRIKNAILFYEARIHLDEVELDITQAEEGIIFIEISYTISRVNSRHNIVFPFFIKEGTLVPRL